MMVILFSIGASFLLAVLLGPLFIPLLRRLKFGQQIRTDGPQSHLKKKRHANDGRHYYYAGALIAFLKFSDKTPEFWVL